MALLSTETHSILNIKINKLKHILTSLDSHIFHSSLVPRKICLIMFSHPKLEHMMMMIAALFCLFAPLGFPMAFSLILLFAPHAARAIVEGESIKQIVSIQSHLISLAVQIYQILISCRAEGTLSGFQFFFRPRPYVEPASERELESHITHCAFKRTGIIQI